MNIHKAMPSDMPEIARLAGLLWPDHEPDDLDGMMEALLAGGQTVFFLAEEEGRAIGFAQCGLRHDYVEGTDSSPVGYLEGIYVEEGHRRRGTARALVQTGEAWAKSQGCREFASDCELDNTLSIAFHLGSGFAEANRVVCFVKPLS